MVIKLSQLESQGTQRIKLSELESQEQTPMFEEDFKTTDILKPQEAIFKGIRKLVPEQLRAEQVDPLEAGQALRHTVEQRKLPKSQEDLDIYRNRGFKEILPEAFGAEVQMEEEIGLKDIATPQTLAFKGARKLLPEKLKAEQYGTLANIGDQLDYATEPRKVLSTIALIGGIGVGAKGAMLGIKGIPKAANYLSSLGKKGIDALKKSAPDYLTTKIAPAVENTFKKGIEKFTPQIQKYAKQTLKIPQSVINTIKKKGFGNVKKTRQAYGDSVIGIKDRITKGFDSKLDLANKTYQKAMDSFPANKSIDITPVRDKIGLTLRRLKFADPKGNITQRGLNEGKLNSVYSKLIRLYDDLGQNARPYWDRGTFTDTTKIRANKELFKYYRDIVNDLYKEKGTDRAIREIADTLYATGEKAGMKGLGKARTLYRRTKEVEKNLNVEKYISERNLNNYHKLPETSKRKIKAVQDYLGDNFIDDLEAITTKDFTKGLEEVNVNSIMTDLNKAVNPKYTKVIYNKYKEILGEKEARSIFNEVSQHTLGQKIKTSAIRAAKGIGYTGGGLYIYGKAKEALKG